MQLARQKLNRIWEIGMVLFSLSFIGCLATLVYQHAKVQHLTLAAGSPTGEGYIVCAALKTVTERHHPEIRITLLETGGTVENLKLMADGRAAMAVAQADVLAGPSARIVAILYDDTFQLLTRREKQMEGFPGLKGKRIALPRTGGQFQSFLRVADHFGLQESDFQFVGSSDVTADEAFSQGRADAIFRVRALGNPTIQRLVQSGKFQLVRIDHAAAMKINQPAFDPTVIPAGAYSGDPAIPDQDLPSIAVHRTLLANASVDDETVRAITGALIDDRQEIAREIPEQVAAVRLLLAHVRRPEARTEFGPALHPGAVKFYDKDKPSFILAHADYIGLILTVLVMISSWVWELRAWLQRQQKNIADEYSNRVITLMNAAQQAESREALQQIRGDLLGVLTAAVGDLDSDKLSEESFHSFRAILQIGLEAVRDSWNNLQVAGHST
jgi:hypothetical protein